MSKKSKVTENDLINQLINQVKDLRLKLHSFLNTTRTLPGSRTMNLAITNVERAKMWMGKLLENLGSATPYPQSENPQSPQIEPMAESTLQVINLDLYPDLVAKVKFLRQYLEGNFIEKFQEFSRLRFEFPNQENTDYKILVGSFISFTNALSALIESKMWLGMVLNDIFEKNCEK